jgi:hypothetical protein
MKRRLPSSGILTVDPLSTKFLLLGGDGHENAEAGKPYFVDCSGWFFVHFWDAWCRCRSGVRASCSGTYIAVAQFERACLL